MEGRATFGDKHYPPQKAGGKWTLKHIASRWQEPRVKGPFSKSGPHPTPYHLAAGLHLFTGRMPAPQGTEQGTALPPPARDS